MLLFRLVGRWDKLSWDGLRLWIDQYSRHEALTSRRGMDNLMRFLSVFRLVGRSRQVGMNLKVSVLSIFRLVGRCQRVDRG
mmetsp:Transcript_5540/g.8565  ORF Transcript_5540/g.8565 Transcript_5540/m.8565 type:complete len:81 (+) Transcript_5540:21-263(+)